MTHNYPNLKPITPEEIEYTALFIDNPEKLLEIFPARHQNILAHHCTNWHKPSSIEELEMGKKSLLKIIGQAYDDRCFALLVENPKSKNTFPHITISHSKDVSAAYSNQLLENASNNNSIEIFETPFFIKVTEGYATRNDRRIILE